MFPILLIFSDWTYLLLRLIFGGLFAFSGYRQFKKTRRGLSDLIVGLSLFLGFLANFAALFIFIRFLTLLILRRPLDFNRLSFYLLTAAVALFIFTYGAGFLSLDGYFFSRL